mmetsp:Transcript_58913/g.175109  ORF Transcript_58913/g.175109 Transcript_58913/m.175109 type:complete len:250 (+) Transcript_58913:645-1394(+)
MRTAAIFLRLFAANSFQKKEMYVMTLFSSGRADTISTASSIRGIPIELSAMLNAWSRLTCLLILVSFEMSTRSGRYAWIRALKAMPSCQLVWKLMISMVPFDTSFTLFCAHNSNPSLAVRSPSEICCTLNRRMSDHTIPRMSVMFSSKMFSAEYWLGIFCAFRKSLMYFSGKLRFSTFWNFPTGLSLYFPSDSSAMTSMSLISLTPSPKSLERASTARPSRLRCEFTHAVKVLICIRSRVASSPDMWAQ